MDFQAVYYSGIKPKGQAVTFQIEGEEIRIFDEENEELSLWNKELLSRQHYNENHLLIKWGIRDPFEYLEIQDSTAIEALNQAFPQKKFFEKPGFTWGSFYSILAIVAFSTVLLFFTAYFYGLPSLTQWASEKVPLDWELKIGQASIEKYSESAALDSLKTQYLNDFYNELGHHSKYQIQFYYLKDSIVNAFAMPGGFIVINDGIMDKMTDYRQLVGLMGHEIAHIEERHTLKTIFKSLGAYFVIQLALGHFGAVSGVLIENLSSIQNLSYSREFELAADRASFYWMKNLKISTNGMVDMFNVLKMEEAKNIQNLPEFLSTHPMTEDRIQKIKDLIQNEPLSVQESEFPRLDVIFEKLTN
ncbi:MAG TPA: M48 family metallopeptidase [Saprospiraceae bacterium]|nr:M48 family metallopeptidase [Saprospiraceae bacterium]